MKRDPSLKQASAMRAKSGFKDYSGPVIDGPRTVIPFGDRRYPQALARIPSPPECLYVVGDPASLSEGLAVIGARKATPYGLGCAQRFSRLAAEQGIPIVSGGAYGCDAAAHRAALDCGGVTVAFLGGGCDQLYPPKHQPLFQEIVDKGGAVVSEHEWSYPALPFTFRSRNRLIAGLARATLIVEAGLPSGTFSTADEALAAGKEVLVVPGAITSRASAGSNRLLYQGAVPIVDDESFRDTLFGLFGCIILQNAPSDARAADALPAKRLDPVLAALRAQPMRLEDLVVWLEEEGSGESQGRLMLRLAELERDRFIARYPDGRYGPLLQ